MVRKLVFLIGILIFSLPLYGMELEDLNKDKKRSDLAIDLGAIPQPLSKLKGKRSVQSLEHVVHLKQHQTTQRSTTGRGSSNDGVSEKKRHMNSRPILSNSDGKGPFNQEDDNGLQLNDDIVNSSGVRKLNTLEMFSGSGNNQTYSAQQMWALLEKSNPKLHEFATENHLSLGEVMECQYNFASIHPNIQSSLYGLAKKRDLSLDEIMEYAGMLEEFDISPKAIGELVQRRHPKLSSNTIKVLVLELQVEQENDPQAYIEKALEFIERTCGNKGIGDASPINSKVIATQDKTIAQEKREFWYSVAGNIAQGIFLMGAAAWALYNQIYNPPSPTDAPTNSPTGIPTYMPTQSPT